VASPPPAPSDSPAPGLSETQDTGATAEVISADPAGQAPRTITIAPAAAKAQWHWYYLAPLGIGQFLAGSPVRGTLFLVLQLGFVAANVAGTVLFNSLRVPEGGFANPQRAQAMQVLMNVGFFGLIGSALAGTIDGAFFEP
jgi:hypothetical protein